MDTQTQLFFADDAPSPEPVDEPEPPPPNDPPQDMLFDLELVSEGEPLPATRNVTPTELGFEVRVAPDLKAMVKPLEGFTTHPDNSRKHNLARIAKSLKDYGQQTALVAQRSTGYVVKGNGTMKALLLLGAKEAAISVEDFDDNTALRYLLDDNKTSDDSSYDARQLVTALNKLTDLGDTLWDIDELETLEASLGDVKELDPEFKGGYAESEETTEARREAASQPGEKMREIPVVLSIAEHAVFMQNLFILKRAFGTTGHVATIVEAVRRMAVQLTPEAATMPLTPPTATDEPSEDDLLGRL